MLTGTSLETSMEVWPYLLLEDSFMMSLAMMLRSSSCLYEPQEHIVEVEKIFSLSQITESTTVHWQEKLQLFFIAFSSSSVFSNTALGTSLTWAAVFPGLSIRLTVTLQLAKPRVENQWTPGPEIATDELLGLFFVTLDLEALSRSLSLYNLSLLTLWFSPLILQTFTKTVKPALFLHVTSRLEPLLLTTVKPMQRDIWQSFRYDLYCSIFNLCKENAVPFAL